jgi:hypothetical protein
LTGDESNPLSEPEIAALTGYLDAGGKLFISSQNLGEALGSHPFYTDYLQAQFKDPDMDIPLILGTSGDPIGQGDTCLLAGGGGAQNAKSCDGIEPIDGATPVFSYRGSSHSAGIKYEGGYKLVYFAFPFEAVDGGAEYTQRPGLMRRILDWFGGVLEAVKEPGDFPASGLRLSCQPNPFGSRTSIQFQLKVNQRTRLEVYDVSGQALRRLIDAEIRAGAYRVEWDGRDSEGQPVPAGVYFLYLETPDIKAIEKVVYLR